jgi:hypothetical protein
MEQWFIVDADGLLVDVILSDTVFHLDEGFRVVTHAWQEPFYKPRHDAEMDEWVEGETAEERAAREAEANKPQPIAVETKVATLEAKSDEMAQRTEGMQEIDFYTLDQVGTLDSRSQDAQDVDDYALSLIFELQTKVAELEAKLNGGAA